jgi:hypothetical protein
MLGGILGEDGLTISVTLLTLVIVWIPFVRGIRVTFKGWTATRWLGRPELDRVVGRGADGTGVTDEGVEPLAAHMARILANSLAEDATQSRDFVLDASRQYVISEYDLYYTRPISMFASLMPPIGFIGTTVGMLILFVSMHRADTSLELGALAIALTSSIFALIAYAILESVKIRLYNRLLLALREVELRFGAIRSRTQQGASPA